MRGIEDCSLADNVDLDRQGELFDWWFDRVEDADPVMRKVVWQHLGPILHRMLGKESSKALGEMLLKRARAARDEERNEEVRAAADEALSEALRVGPESGPTGEEDNAPPPEQFDPPPQPPGTALDPTLPPGAASGSGSPPGDDRRRFADWFWELFPQSSLVHLIACPQARLRDEQAAIELARRLSHADFPGAKFKRVGPGQLKHTVRDLEIQAIAFIGRLGLYGDEAVRTWSMPGARFTFNMPHRPPGLAAGHVSPAYHLIKEDLGPSHDPIPYPTVQDAGQRRDYALIQSYVVRPCEREIRCVVISGASALGTLAACYWLSTTIYEANSAGEYLWLPEKVRPRSTMEALLEVTADVDTEAFSWELGSLKLRRLQFDDYVFDEESASWLNRSPKALSVLFAKGAGKELPNDQVEDVLFDGKASRMRHGAENFKLLVAMCRLAHANGGLIDPDRLAADPWVWTPATRKAHKDWDAHVRRRMWSLRYHLGAALVIGPDRCELTSDVDLVRL